MTDSSTTHPGSWSRIENDLPDIRHENIAVLLKLWPEIHNVTEDDPKWGDEVEYLLVSLDSDTRKPTLFTGTADVLKRFHEQDLDSHFDLDSEAYKFMLESAPSEPYGSSLRQALQVEPHLRSRRTAIQSLLMSGTHVFTISSFGLLSINHHRIDREHNDRHTAGGLLTEDFRYQSVVDTIFQRCDGFPTTSVPRRVPKSKPDETGSEAVVLDNPVYVIGSCGLQVTFGMRDLQETLFLHDQLCTIAPLTTALTAASPVFKGSMVSTDAKFGHASSVIDDRQSSDLTPTARWSSSPLYLENLPEVRALNPPPRLTTEAEKRCAQQFEAEGMPSTLSEYLAYTVCRPPLLHPKLVADDNEEGVVSSNETTGLSKTKISRLESHLSNLYPAVRLKLPSWPRTNTNGSLPWRLEFRAMEVPPTDFECAAMLIFLRLLKQAIIDFHLELRIPMHLLEENMNRAHVAGAVRSQRFWFNVRSKSKSTCYEQEINGGDTRHDGACYITELSLDEIINGQSQSQSHSTSMDSSDPRDSSSSSSSPTPTHQPSPSPPPPPYPGLLHFIHRTLATMATSTTEPPLSKQESHNLEKYLNFISQRASGVNPTPAQWTREFVASHPLYAGQGEVSPEVYHDFLSTVLERVGDESC